MQDNGRIPARYSIPALKQSTACHFPEQNGLNYYGKVKKLFTVAPGNFLPAPSVTSAVIRIELYESNPYTVKSEKMLFDTISGAFAQRRKTMLNSLASTMSFVSKERIGQIINEIGFDTNIRGEKLSISDFCALADKLYEEKTK